MDTDTSLSALEPRTSATLPLPPRRAAAPDDDLAIDALRYAVTGEIARGGMGRIIAAVDRHLGRKVAIKVCLHADPALHDRLAREAAILSLLEHRSIPPIYELGRLRGGAPYFATRRFDGVTLDARLGAAPDAWRALVPQLAAVAEVMAYVHGRGVLHRDLKPSNLLVADDGSIAIIDWGIARSIRPASASTDPATAPQHVVLTSPGMASGTPGYWPPEQRRGEAGDERSDVYSLGAILYRMVVGRSLQARLPTGDPIGCELRGAPPWLVELIVAATADEPDARPASMAELAAALRRGLARIEAPIVVAAAAAGRRRSRAQVIVPAVAAVILLGLPWRDGRSPSSARAATGTPAQVLSAPGYWTGDFEQMIFSVDGDGAVRGVYAHDDGVFAGRLDGDRVVGHWCEAPYASGKDAGAASFVVGGDRVDGARIGGHWRYRDDDEWAGRWNLHRVAGPVPPALAARLAAAAWRCAPP